MNDETEQELPQALIDRLREQDQMISMLTPQIDRTILAQAEAQFAARTSTRRTRRAPVWGISAAAAAALMFVLISVRSPSLPGDYDGSGNIDVLDAFALTRELAANPQFAANETVDSLMQRVVSLDGGLQ